MRPAGEVAMLIVEEDKAEEWKGEIGSISEIGFNVKRKTKSRR